MKPLRRRSQLTTSMVGIDYSEVDPDIFRAEKGLDPDGEGCYEKDFRTCGGLTK